MFSTVRGGAKKCQGERGRGAKEWQCKTKVMMKEKCDQAVLKSMTSGYSRSLLQPTQLQGVVGGGRVEAYRPFAH